MNNDPPLRTALRAGRRVYGTLIVSPSPRWPDTVAELGLDFVFIDTEHIALDRAQLSWMCQAYRTLSLPPIVRIPSPDPTRPAWRSMAWRRGSSPPTSRPWRRRRRCAVR